MLSGLHRSLDTVYRELVKFGAVGILAFIVDVGVFNLLRTGLPGMGGALTEKPLTAKTISVVLATLVAWLGNRYWTFRHRRRASRRHELVLFVVMNAGGLLIALACLAGSHYVLGLRSALDDNISSNVVGLLLGTAFRFWAYRKFVFTEELAELEAQAQHEPVPDRVLPADHVSATEPAAPAARTPADPDLGASRQGASSRL